jgi:5'-methylthioadenosine phosphorylase
MAKASIAIIGGSGTYNVEGVKQIEELNIETPFGKTSDTIKIVEIEGRNIAFLPRHGKGHRINPSEIPVKANIWALKSIGVERIITISAVGSLREEIPPCDFVIPDQLIDRTKGRDDTFFKDGVVGHVAFAEPFCKDQNENVYNTINSTGTVKIHKDKTYVCMEGPLFSTVAESKLYRSWGADIIGMTALPEAKLAREAGMCYTCIAMSTDYDCWHPEHESVTLDMILKNAKVNGENAQKVLKDIIKNIPAQRTCACKDASKYAIVTDKNLIPAEVKKKLEVLFGEYF